MSGTVKTTTAKNKERVGQLGQAMKTLDTFTNPNGAANTAMIEAALKSKAALSREYLRMCLLLMAKDDLWDRYFDISINQKTVKIPPFRRLQLSSQERTLLLAEIFNATAVCNQKAKDAEIAMDTTTGTPWDWVKMEGQTPSATLLIYAHKQVLVQDRLVDLMRKPVGDAEVKVPAKDAAAGAAVANAAAGQPKPAAEPARPPAEAKPAAGPANAGGAADKAVVVIGAQKPAPLVLLLNKISFKVPEIEREDSEGPVADPRYIYYSFLLDVSLLPENAPILIERILDCGLPLSIVSLTVERGMDKISANVKIQAGQAHRTLVNVKVECKVLDFSIGIGKVVFAKGKFPTPGDVDKFLKEQTDPVMLSLKREVEKGTLVKESDGSAIEYVVYGDRLKGDVQTCELEKGITVYYGATDHNVPELGRR